MKIYFSFIFIVFSFSGLSQSRQLSSRAEISIITIGPGPNYYDCFGHSAFRVKDPLLNFDLVYNYGSFNSEEPGFYKRFALGEQEYFLGAYGFKRFLGNYQAENRWVKEQVLNLTKEEVQELYELMEKDLQPENKYYRYDPYFNSCGTKMRDLVVEVLGDEIVFTSFHLKAGTTLRELTHGYGFNHPWWDLGTHLALGTIMDRDASPNEHMFLPDYVFAAYEHATINRDGKKIPALRSVQTLFESDAYQLPEQMIRPWVIFVLLMVLVLYITWCDLLKNRRSRWLDFTLMLLTGLLGMVICFLWCFTSHSTTPNNLNVLWAFFPNLFMAFVMLKKNPPRWIRLYFWLLIFLLQATALSWISGVQIYANALIPIFVLLAVRYFYLSKVGLVRTDP